VNVKIVFEFEARIRDLHLEAFIVSVKKSGRRCARPCPIRGVQIRSKREFGEALMTVEANELKETMSFLASSRSPSELPS
jgi:hypothetical protein